MTMLLLWLLMQAGVPQQPAGTGAISGSVVALDTGKPIAGAVVDLTSFEPGAPPKRTSTGVEGKFQFADLPAHTYVVVATADKFLRMYFGQQQPGPAGLNNTWRTIDLHDGEQFRSADFKMWRQSALEGTIVDEFGAPAPNVAIQLSQVQFAGGKRRLFPMGGTAPNTATDDKGQFRITGLAPGEYYVTALTGAFADPDAAGGFAMTFYPGTASAGRAQPVTVTPGKDASHVDFQLVPASTRRVAGIVVDGDGKPLGRTALMLMPSENGGTSSFTIVRMAAGPDGRFVFRNVPVGPFTIQAYGAQVPGGGGNLGSFAFGWLTFKVEDRDIDGLTVVVPPPRSIRGHITFDGDATPQPRPGEVRIFPAPMDFESAPVGGGPPPFKVNSDWTFEVNAMSGLRAMQVTAGAWVVEKITRGGLDVTDVALDLREKDVNDLDIVLTTRATTVTGAVTLPDGSPAKDYNVVIYSDDESKWKLWSRYVVLTRPNQQGAFSVRGLPAGVYLAVVAPTMANGQWQNPEFLTAMRAQATRFAIGEGETRALQLKMKTP